MIDILITRFAAEEASGIGALGLDKKAFVIQLVTFLLAFYILNRFVFGKVINLLERRRKTIEEGISLTTQMQAEKEKLEEEIALAHKEVRKEADELIAASRDQAAAIVSQAEETARAKADRLIAEAREKISEETQKAKQGLEKDVVDLVISTTEQITREKLTGDKDRALVNNTLREQL